MKRWPKDEHNDANGQLKILESEDYTVFSRYIQHNFSKTAVLTLDYLPFLMV